MGGSRSVRAKPILLTTPASWTCSTASKRGLLIYVAELRLKTIYAAPLPVPVFKPLERFPSIERDLSFVVDNGIEYDIIILAIKSLNIADLREVQLIDFYKGPKLPPQKVGLTVRLTFGNPERTLTQDEVTRYGDEVLSALTAGLGVELRS